MERCVESRLSRFLGFLYNNNPKKARKAALFRSLGVVIGVTDGIVAIVGMAKVAYGETVNILANTKRISCMVLNVERNRIGAIALDSDVHIKPGLYVVCSGMLMSVPAGDALLGRIVDPLGKPIDSKGVIPTRTRRMVEHCTVYYCPNSC